MAETEMYRQYQQIKAQYPDAILFFRLGDFYETFHQDAELVHRELGLTLTQRSVGKETKIPMAGIPYHAVDRYLPKLIEAGYKVAVCEQLTKPGAKLIKRDVVRVVTPGTIFEDEMLVSKRNNFLAALVLEEKAAGLAYADISTGEFFCTQLNEATAEEVRNGLRTELARISPSEMLAPKPKERRNFRPEQLFATGEDEDPYELYRVLLPSVEGDIRRLTPTEFPHWQLEEATRLLKEHFEVGNLESFGCAALPLAVRAAGALVAYLRQTQKAISSRLNPLITYSTQRYMALDMQTRRNLELSENRRSGSRKLSLFGVLDLTNSAMGGRMLHRWLNQPLLDLNRILARQEAVTAFYNNTHLRESVRALLKEVDDIERFGVRASSQMASPREMLGLRQTLELVPAFRDLFAEAPADTQKIFKSLLNRMHACEDLVGMLQKAIPDDPPGKKWTKGAIRSGYNAELDRLREISEKGKSWVEEFQQTEIARTGISSLKVKFNEVFGYFIEVTSSNLSKIPADYVRKQTIANGERFITSELKEWESKILTANEKIEELESDLFKEILSNVANSMAQLVEVASALAHLDVFSALAEVAVRHNYIRPTLNEGNAIAIKGGRHPIVEQATPENIFVPNDSTLNNDQEQILLITGPNMAGKSVYLRQTAIIVLLAQVGAYVPAEAATIGLVDRIFTRIGAQDDIATGQSTFMVEMVETSHILSHATPRSLVILDEVGRGTSTYDGLAIAQAVVEYLHNNSKSGAKTLFATHYHELIELSNVLPRVRNYNMAVREENGKVTFMRKVVPGGADRSYGIHVAQLAGLPRPVVRRAEELLQLFEGQKVALEELSGKSLAAANGRNGNGAKPASNGQQMNFFASPEPAPVAVVTPEPPADHPILAELRDLKVFDLNPMQAMNKLYELQQKLLKD